MKLSTKDMVLCSIFASITAILAQIAIPLPGGVPFTLQVFAVTLTGVILGAKRGFISQLVYVLLGAIGIPVFANFSGGISNILGPTGGYILAFPLMALVVGYASQKYNNLVAVLIGMLIALILDYFLGTLQFSIIAKMDFMKSMSLCVIPFVVFDLIKVVIASIVGLSLKNKIGVSLAKN